MLNSIRFFVLIIALIKIISGQSDESLFVSTCLNNCRSCSQTAPSICTAPNLTTVTRCVPYFTNQNCVLTSSFQNLALQNGNSNELRFAGWTNAQNQALQTRVCRPIVRTGLGNQTSTFNLQNERARTTLGTFNSLIGNSIRKTFTLPNRQIQLLNFKFTMTVNDDRLQNLTSQSDANIRVDQERNPDGTIVTTETTSVITINGIEVRYQPFLLVSFINAGNLSAEALRTVVLQYKLSQPSRVRTDCGFVYQFQVQVPIPSPSISSVLVTMELQTRPNVSIQWNFVESRVDFGCGGFLASARCDACLTGFYQIRQPLRNKLMQCGLCPAACKTCSAANACSACEPFASIVPNTGICEYPIRSFSTQNKYNLTRGRIKSGSSSQVRDIIVSEQGQISMKLNLPQFQIYAIKMYLLYTDSYITRTQGGSINIEFSDQKTQEKKHAVNINALQLERYTAFYDQTISINNKLFIKQIIINTDFQNQKIVGQTDTLSIKSNFNTNDVSLNESLREFYVYNIQITQLKCIPQCLNCTNNANFAQNQCVKCKSFFIPESSCRSCANGFFQRRAPVSATTQQNVCVKCPSICRQCRGSSKQSCLQCFPNFELGPLAFTPNDYKCIRCIFERNNGTVNPSSCSPQCLRDFSIARIRGNQNCSFCLSNVRLSDVENSINCRSCFLENQLVSAQCRPITSKGFQFYGNDVESQTISFPDWSRSGEGIAQFDCTNDYRSIYGISRSLKQANETYVIKRTQKSLPAHRGLAVFMNIMKVDRWTTANPTITIKTSTGLTSSVSKEIKFSNDAGTNICKGPGNQLLFTFSQTLQQHSFEGQFAIQVIGSPEGLYVWQLQIYLGNCQECGRGQLNYQIEYIPRYFYNDSQAGLDTWLKFNQPTRLIQNQNGTVQNSFQFTIDKLGINQFLPKSETQNLLTRSNQLRYFIPLSKSFSDGTLTANTTKGNFIVAQPKQVANSRLLFIEKLRNFQISTKVERFDDVNGDDRLAIGQIWQFYNFFNWFTLIAMIVFAFFGIGIIFQELSILLQLQFWHIYITSFLLPATFKVPLSAMQKMENLNFFAYPSAQNIERSWINEPLNHTTIVSPHIFEQYNQDVFFLRSFYPLIIVNLIYLAWFIILYAVNRFVRAFRRSPSKIVKFIRNIPRRPVNYADQIFRYQFLTVLWSAFLQFLNFDNSTDFKRFILALCIISLAVAIAWPIFVALYTYRRNKSTNIQHFLYSYQDVYYRKITSISDKQFKFYFYIIIRSLRYAFYAIFIAFFAYQPIIGPAIFIFVNIVELGYLFKFKIFQDKVYFTFKVIENLLFVVIQILLLIVYGAASTMQPAGFLSLGYVLTAIFVIMIVNGVFRFLYLLWKKVSDFLSNKFDYGEQGQVSDYGNRNPIQQIENLQ